jgi:hypothetical protein
MFPGMEPDRQTLDEWRAQRLKEAVKQLANDNHNEFGRRMGYKNGDYIRQMIAMRRPISEKFMWKFEEVTGLNDWFDPAANDSFGSLAQQIRIELATRDAPEHFLRTFLDALRSYPVKRVASNG